MALRKDFLYGFATASAQIEGGGPESEKESGRGMSIWDDFCNTPGKIRDGSRVNKTCDHYRRFKEDVALMKSLGVNAYRFSIAWTRIIPDGGKDDPINEKGIKFYSDLIDECLANGITPFATLYHWDLPSALDKRYNGWLDRRVIPDFVNYARICFERFGDRVKHWLTFNEPWCISVLGYGIGQFAPGHESDTEPWIAGHNVILSHAHVAQLYKSEFKSRQGGQIGITLNGDWTEPYDQSPENVHAAQEKMDFALGWFADPIYLGLYPPSMVKRLGERLPKFTEEEIALVKGSSEFYGCNTYTTNTIKAGGGDDFSGGHTMFFAKPDGTEIGVESQLGWLRDVPWGFRKLLVYLHKRYNKPIYCTENGWAIKGEYKLSPEDAIHDKGRVEYYTGYLKALKEAVVEDGVDVRSYFGYAPASSQLSFVADGPTGGRVFPSTPVSGLALMTVLPSGRLMDNMEWNSGLIPRFGSVHTNSDTFERRPKDSAGTLVQFFQENVASK